MVAEILEALAPKPGNLAVDATLGYGGHTHEILPSAGRTIAPDSMRTQLSCCQNRSSLAARWDLGQTIHRASEVILPACRKCSRKPESPARTSFSPILACPRCRLTTRARFLGQTGRPARYADESAPQPIPAAELLQRLKPEALAEMLVRIPTNHATTSHRCWLEKTSTTRALANTIRSALPRFEQGRHRPHRAPGVPGLAHRGER